MSINKGKIFEDRFRENWKKSFPKTFIYRLADQVTGFKNTSQNPCDYLCFPGDKLFMIECKSHDGASIPFAAIPQYERLLEYKNYKNVCPGFVIWFKEKDIIIWVDIAVAEKIFNDGNKSIQLKMLTDEKYDLKKIPAVKKRVYLDADYTFLVNLYKEI